MGLTTVLLYCGKTPFEIKEENCGIFLGRQLEMLYVLQFAVTAILLWRNGHYRKCFVKKICIAVAQLHLILLCADLLHHRLDDVTTFAGLLVKSTVPVVVLLTAALTGVWYNTKRYPTKNNEI